MKKTIYTALATAVVAIAGACSGPSAWTVEGTIEGAPEGTRMAVEGFNHNNWYVIDSVDIDKSGQFAYHSPTASAVPDIYRLGCDGKYIYFPIDSVETINIDTKYDAFNREYTLSGSNNAVEMMRIDHAIDSIVDRFGENVLLADAEFKSQLNNIVLSDSIGTLAYYIINKTVGGRPLYAADNRQDVGILGAVAQKFTDLRPNDPRTKYLTDLAIQRRRAISNTTPQVLEVNATGLFDIELYDENGDIVSLAQVASQGNPVILSFTNYDLSPSAAYNVELSKLYNKHHSAGLEIYQVAVANDEARWRPVAKNLPWITVWSSPGQSNALLMQYNVDALPVSFIINRNGDITERVLDPTQLGAAVAKVM